MIGVTWTGWDGSVWDLNSGPVRLDSRGAEGFGSPTLVRPVVESAGRDGQRRTGLRARAKAREGFFPVTFLSDGDADWEGLQRAWWDSWSSDDPGTITVTSPSGLVRNLSACFSDDGGYKPTSDPSTQGAELAGVTWVADDPWWRGTPVSRRFASNPTPVDFFNGGAAPPFQIGVSALTGAVSLPNPGRLEAWPVYTIEGPATGFTVTVGGHSVAGAVAVADGETLTVDTDPVAQIALLTAVDGTSSNVTPYLALVDFAPIPAGGSEVGTVELVGTGTLTVTVTPRFIRAW